MPSVPRTGLSTRRRSSILGDAYEEKKEQLSLEKCVGSQVPRAFVWHTFEDEAVPVQNSLLLVNALVENRIPTEFHMFENGGHGLSLANRLTNFLLVKIRVI